MHNIIKDKASLRVKRIGVIPTSFQLVESINPDYDSLQLAFVIVWLAVVLILIYFFREKRKKNKYEPEKNHDRDDPNNYWGGLSGGKPIGPPN